MCCDRGEGEVQVGLDPPLGPGPARHTGRARLTAAADRLRPARTPTTRPRRSRLLEGHGALIDERDLMPLLGADDISPHTTAALARAVGPAAGDARRARRGASHAHPLVRHPTVPTHSATASWGSPGPRGWALPAAPACPTAACWSAPASRTASCSTAGCATGSPTSWCGSPRDEPSSGRSWCPGATACLRCLDAHCTDADPSWPLLVRQYATASSRRPRRRRPRAGRPAARGAGAGVGRPRPRVVRRRAAAVHVVGDAHHPPVTEQPRDPPVAAPPGLRVQLGVIRRRSATNFTRRSHLSSGPRRTQWLHDRPPPQSRRAHRAAGGAAARVRRTQRDGHGPSPRRRLAESR